MDVASDGSVPCKQAAREIDNTYVHDYGKAPRPGRKLGHVTVIEESSAARDKFLDTIRRTVTQSSS